MGLLVLKIGEKGLFDAKLGVRLYLACPVIALLLCRGIFCDYR